jgi:hypothetical protein
MLSCAIDYVTSLRKGEERHVLMHQPMPTQFAQRVISTFAAVISSGGWT